MMNVEGDSVADSNSDSRRTGACDIAQAEATVSTLVKMDVEETVIVPESKEMEENAPSEVVLEEKFVAVMKNKTNAVVEEENTGAAKEFPHNETSAVEEEQHDKTAMCVAEKLEGNGKEVEEKDVEDAKEEEYTNADAIEEDDEEENDMVEDENEDEYDYEDEDEDEEEREEEKLEGNAVQIKMNEKTLVPDAKKSEEIGEANSEKKIEKSGGSKKDKMPIPSEAVPKTPGSGKKRKGFEKLAAIEEDKQESSHKRKAWEKRDEAENGVGPSDKKKALKRRDDAEDVPESYHKKATNRKGKAENGPESSLQKKTSKRINEVEDMPGSSTKKKASKAMDEVEDMPRSSHKKKISKKRDEVEDGSGSSHKRKASNKRSESMGMIFMCSSKTKEDCYRYKVLGLPANKRDIVQKIYKGMRLFLFDFDLRLMYGIYKAAGPGGYNVEPKAFKSAFPSQVRFAVLHDCLPLAEEKFKKIIKDNYYAKNKFNCQLNSEQVKNLCMLFLAASGKANSKKSARNLKPERHRPTDRDRIRSRHPVEERRSALGVERHYSGHQVVYERQTFVPEVPPITRYPPVRPTLDSPPSYATYGRALETDVYRRDRLVEDRGYRLSDLELRHEDRIDRHRSYLSYREAPVYRGTQYSAVLVPRDRSPPTRLLRDYRGLAAVPSEYSRPVAAPLEYDHQRHVYRL